MAGDFYRLSIVESCFFVLLVCYVPLTQRAETEHYTLPPLSLSRSSYLHDLLTSSCNQHCVYVIKPWHKQQQHFDSRQKTVARTGKQRSVGDRHTDNEERERACGTYVHARQAGLCVEPKRISLLTRALSACHTRSACVSACRSLSACLSACVSLSALCSAYHRSACRTLSQCLPALRSLCLCLPYALVCSALSLSVCMQGSRHPPPKAGGALALLSHWALLFVLR